jgi:hypothetical protein
LRITVLALCRSGNKNKQTRSGKDKSTRSYESCHSIQASRHGHTMRKFLLSSPAELITRDHCRPMRTLVQKMYISLTNALRIMESEDLRDKSYVMSRGNHVRGKQEDAGLAQREPQEVWDKEVWPILPHFCLFRFLSVDLLLVSVQPKHQTSLFRYRSETTETKVLFRIVPKLVSVLVSVVSNRNYFRRTPYFWRSIYPVVCWYVR